MVRRPLTKTASHKIGFRNRTFESGALLLAPEQLQLPQRIGIIVERQAGEVHSHRRPHALNELTDATP
jgi:hypothetical protein